MRACHGRSSPAGASQALLPTAAWAWRWRCWSAPPASTPTRQQRARRRCTRVRLRWARRLAPPAHKLQLHTSVIPTPHPQGGRDQLPICAPSPTQSDAPTGCCQ
jgi:hypothetical protein